MNDSTDPPPSPSPTRGSSPSPSISPTPALLPCPPLDRSLSDGSSISTLSGRSGASRSSWASVGGRRLGYVRPQGARFAESAKQRESVMSLGSIAHLQYYFARTGLLQGKGGQLARGPKRKGSVAVAGEDDDHVTEFGEVGTDFLDSPVEGDELHLDWQESLMLPPTVSTYNQRVSYIPPPPDAATLHRELLESLELVNQAMADARKMQAEGQGAGPAPVAPNELLSPDVPSPARGRHQIQGVHILDVVTLAIRSAKEYYTMHEHPERLRQVKSERTLREELLQVMDVLKRMAIRNFAHGIRGEEVEAIADWTRGVEDTLAKEKRIEAQEARDRRSWRWLAGSWPAGDRKREVDFMRTFLVQGETLPEWTTPSEGDDQPTPFLEALSNGLTLVLLHNRVLKKCKRKFGEIKTHHEDTAKPYRCADNLRYWVKAAEIRWEAHLQIDVMGIVHNEGKGVWREFDDAVFQWCRILREEITLEWKQGSVQVTPSLLVA